MAEDFGLTDRGFVIKRLADLQADQVALAIQLFQDRVAVGDTVDTSSSAALGRLIALSLPAQADLWEVAQQVDSAFNPASATGIALDNLVALSGLVRKDANSTTALGLLTGSVGVTVPANVDIQSTTRNEIYNLSTPVTFSPVSANGIGVSVLTVADASSYTVTYTDSSTSSTSSYTSGAGATQTSILNGLKTFIDANQPALTANINNNILYVNKKDRSSLSNFTVSSNLGISKASNLTYLVAENTGPISEEAGSITNILTPVLNWDSVTNPFNAIPGANQETDSELRERFRSSKASRASNIIESLYASLEALDNVEEVMIYENVTDTVDASGIPGHSFMSLVLGGVDSDIAQAIWNNKPAGIRTFGNTSYQILDSQGNPHTINFQRPTQVPVYITVNLTKFSQYPNNGDSLVRQALIDYFSVNFGIGDSVVYSRLYTPINSVPGHQINSLTIGTSPNPTQMQNIPISFTQIASLSSANIIITSTQ